MCSRSPRYKYAMDPLDAIDLDADDGCNRHSGSDDPLDSIPIAEPLVPEPVELEPWATAIAEFFKRRNTSLEHLRGRCICYSGDCSGAEGAYTGLSCVLEAFRNLLNIDISCRYRSGSEIPGALGLPPKLYHRWNHKPEHFFDGMEQRLQRSSPDVFNNNTVVDMDSFCEDTIYHNGFICKDLSSANRTSRKPLDTTLSSSSGASSKTLHAGLAWVDKHHMPITMTENTYSADTIQKLLRLYSVHFPMYVVVIFVLNSLRFGLKAARRRLFCLGLNMEKMEIITPIEQWPDILRQLASGLPQMDIDSIILDDASPIVKQTFCETRDKAQTKQWDGARYDHLRARNAISKRFNVRIPAPPPCRKQLFRRSSVTANSDRYKDHLAVACSRCKPPLCKLIESKWFGSLSDRKQDRLLLETWVRCLLGAGTNAKLLWNMTNGLEYPCRKDPSFDSFVGCICTEHDIWVTWKQRLMCGYEQMLLQGLFPPLLPVALSYPHEIRKSIEHISKIYGTPPVGLGAGFDRFLIDFRSVSVDLR